MTRRADVRVTVDSGSCIAGGQCEMLEPEVFVVDDIEGVASVIGAATLPRDRAEIVVDRCPGRAVRILVDATRTLDADEPTAGE